MTELRLSPREALLLNAALNTNADLAAASWQEWAGQIELEVAPVPELRMLTAVYEHLSAIAPTLSLPQKLRGKARSTFTRNQLIAGTSLEAMDALKAKMPMAIAKGLAVCARFGAWSSRQMGDADVHVPYGKLEESVDILAAQGWVPKYGMTLKSLKHRTPLRRHSWNFSKGHGDIDLHWRLDDNGTGLEQAMWEGARPVTILGKSFHVMSPEFAVVQSLNHGFFGGTRGDVLQSIIDCSKWLPLCDSAKLAELLTKTGRWAIFEEVTGLLGSMGRVSAPPKPSSPTTRTPANLTAGPPMRLERALLHRPALYRAWELLGRNEKIERLLIRFGGPLSRPLNPGPTRNSYDLRDCATIDELAGPGWGWPEPEHTAFWSDRADCRLLVPLPDLDGRVISLTLSEHRLWSGNPSIAVFANGVLVSTLRITEGIGDRDYPLIISRNLLFGPWVELSFRPVNYSGKSGEQYAKWRTLPASFLQVYDAGRLAPAIAHQRPSPLSLNILNGRQPDAEIFARIFAKMIASPFREDARLPDGFDPVVYVLSYRDLFEAEVDPYHHFLARGLIEGRVWR